MKKLLLLLLTFFASAFIWQANAQCVNSFAYGSATISGGAVTTISYCNYEEEYSTISGITAGETYEFTSDAGSYITVYQDGVSSTLLAHGYSPVSVVAATSGNIYPHWTVDAACITEADCITTTVQWTSWTPPPPPANDSCSNAVPILCGDTYTGSTVNATAGDEPPTCGTTPQAPGIWYKYVGQDSMVTLDFCASDFDTRVLVFSGSCGVLTCVGGNDDATPSCSPNLFQSGFTFPASLGTDYYIYVSGYSGATGNVGFDVNCAPLCAAPVNDDCASPTSLTLGLAGTCGANTVTGTNFCAATSTMTTTCEPFSSIQDVWYTATTGTNPNVSMTITDGTGTNWEVAVYSSCPTVANSDIICGAITSGTATTLPLAASTQYWIQVWNNGGADEGTFDICVEEGPPPPANDECAGAVPLTVNIDLACGTVTAGTTVGATASSQTDDVTGTPNNDVWYSFVATGADHRVSILNVVNQGGGTSTSTFMGMGVYDATGGCAGLVFFDDGNNTLDLTGLTASTTYFVRVYGWFSSVQNNDFDICIGTPPPPPANDSCSNAIVVYGGYTITGFSTVGATGTDITSCVYNDVNSVWFAYTAPCNTSVTVNTNGSNFDTGLGLFDACGGTELQCDDDGGTGLQSEITFTATMGTTYYIRIAGYNGATGDVNFEVIENIACPCINNVWTGAVNTDWGTDGNWSCGTAPTSGCAGGTDNAIIPAGVSVTPVVTGMLGVSDLTVATGSSINITGTLQICGDLTHLGNLIGGTGSLEFIGATAQTVTGTGDFSNITVNNAGNGLTADASADIYVLESLILTDGDFTNNGTVTLVSTATSTAYLDDFTNANTYTGNITMERYVTTGSGLGQRYFGSPVVASAIMGLDGTYSGVYPTGQLVPDVCGVSLMVGSPYSNMFEFDQTAANTTTCSDGNWFAISDATTMMPVKGYSGWMNDGTILTATGSPNTGNIAFAVPTTGTTGIATVDGWHLVSNPYPSPLYANAFISAGLTSPQTYEASTGAFAGTFSPVLAVGGELSSMQGLFVENTSAGASVTITNADRFADSGVAWKSSSSLLSQKLEITVNGNGFADITYIVFSDNLNVTNNFDDFTDCKKRSSDAGQPTIYTNLAGEKLSFNSRTESSFGETIEFGVQHDADGNFELLFDGMSSLPSNATIYVYDKQLDVYHNIATGNYSYSALATDNSDRFELVFVLPVEIATTSVDCDGNLGTIALASTNDLANRDFVLVQGTTTIATDYLVNLNQEVNAGDYTLTVNDAFGGNQVYDVTVSTDEMIEADLTVSAVDVQVGDLVSFENLTTNYSNVEWIIGSITTISGVNNPTYIFDEVGTYDVVLNVSNDDCADSKTVTIVVTNKTTSIIDVDGDQTIKIYSVGSEVVFEFTNATKNSAIVKIENTIGQRVFAGTISTDGIQRINVSDVSTAYYFVNLNIDGKSISTKVLLTK